MVERIRTLLESRQLTPTQFADLIGVARPIISHILSGRNKPSLDVVQRILAAMPDLSMAWLLNGTEPMLTATPASTAATPRPAAIPAPTPAVAAASPIATQPPTPQPATTGASTEKTVRQQLDSQPLRPATEPAVVAQPVMPSAAAPAISATPVSIPQPVIAAPRPPMPRRFPVKSAAAAQPAPAASAASIQATSAPAASAEPVATTFNLPDAPPASPAAESTVREVVSAPVTAPVEPQIMAGHTVPSVAATHAAAPAAVAADVAPLSVPMQAAATPPPGPASTISPAPVPAPTLANDMASALFTGAEKPIRRIVIFYRDGSFADYQPE